MDKNRVFPVFLCLCMYVLLFLPDSSWAWGIIQGVVLDTGGVPVYGALIETENGSIKTWTDGSYRMFHLPGSCTVTVSASGYITQSQQVIVTDLQTAEQDFTLPEALLPKIENVYPSLGEVDKKLSITLQGSAFDQHTRLAMYLDAVGREKVISTLPTLTPAFDVTVVGHTAYLAIDTGGLEIVDISDPTRPDSIGSVDLPGNAQGIFVVGDLAYVTTRHMGLQVVDVSDPIQPVVIGSVDTAGSAMNVYVAGEVAYVADAEGGLLAIDVSDPTNPFIAGSVLTEDSAGDVAVLGNIAYVTDRYSGFMVVDVSDPENPVIIGSVDTPGAATSLDVKDNIAYIADHEEGGLQVIDVSDPAHPVIIGSLDTPSYAWDISVVNQIAYISLRHNGLQIVDVSEPAEPFSIGSMVLTESINGLTVSGDIAYVAAQNSGLQMIDVKNPSMRALGWIETPGWPMNVKVVGELAYVTDFADGGLQVIDISDPTEPAIVGSIGTPDAAFDLTVEGNIAYVADRHSGLQVIDVSAPAHPVIVGSVDTPDYANGVTVIGTIAYVADGESGLQVIDVSNPALPVIIGSFDTPGFVQDITISGNTAYVADGSESGLGLLIIDVSDPAQPVSIGSVDTQGSAYSVAVNGSTAYVTGYETGGLQMIDVSDSSHPVIVGSLETPGKTLEVKIIGNTAYVADGYSEGLGLVIIDVGNPAQPVVICSVDTPGMAYGVAIQGNYAYVADYIGGFSIIPLPVEVTDLTVNSDTEITATLPGQRVPGSYILRAFNNLQSSELLGAVTFTDNPDLLHARAIIVAGGGPDATGDIWEETRAYAREAYNSLIYQGYRAENIHYLTDDPTAEGRSGPPERNNLLAAITDWADDDPDTRSLVLYMVDHGEEEQFQLRGSTDPALSEYVTADELDAWLDTLQAQTGMKVLVVYDACHSGSFVAKLREPDDTRVVIASTERDEVAYFLDVRQSFSGTFWSSLSGRTGNPGSLYNAWTLAAGNMANYQAAQLDANGNGVANEPEDAAALEENIFAIGREGFNSRYSRPVVNVVAADQVLAGETSTSLSAWGIYDLDDDDIVRVWAEIMAPDNVTGSSVTVTSLPTVDLADPDEDGRFEAVFPDDAIESYPGFDTKGTYIINYYAEDSSGIYSEPRTALVAQTAGKAVSIPDRYEDDDTAGKAGVIVLNDPSPQVHSFHDNGDVDWVVFYGLAGEVYSVRAINPTVISDPMISIYSGTNLNTPIVSSNTAGMGAEELLKDWTCPADGLYYVRITNTSGHYGANVRYKLKVYNPIAFSLPGYVKGKITSGGKDVAGAVVRAGGGTAITLPDGSFMLCLKPGSYSVSVSCDGYQSTSFSVNVGSGRSVSLSRDMNSVPRILNYPATRIKTNEEYSYVPSVYDLDGDPLTFAITGTPSWANFNSANGRLWGRPSAVDQGIYGPITIKVFDDAGASDSVIFTLKVEQGTAGLLPGVLMLLQEIH